MKNHPAGVAAVLTTPVFYMDEAASVAMRRAGTGQWCGGGSEITQSETSAVGEKAILRKLTWHDKLRLSFGL